MELETALCLGFFWGITFVEICDKLKKKYGKKEIIENKIEEEQLEKFKLLKEKIRDLNNNILKEN
jgi:Fe-S-cluster containining protein